MRRKKIRAIKKNREIIKKYKKEINIFEFCGDIHIKMVCLKCKEIYFIRTHRPELYTEELKKNYICVICRGRKR